MYILVKLAMVFELDRLSFECRNKSMTCPIQTLQLVSQSNSIRALGLGLSPGELLGKQRGKRACDTLEGHDIGGDNVSSLKKLAREKLGWQPIAYQRMDIKYWEQKGLSSRGQAPSSTTLLNELVPIHLVEEYFVKKKNSLLIKKMSDSMKGRMEVLLEKIYDHVMPHKRVLKLTFGRAFLAQELKDVQINWASYARLCTVLAYE